MYMCGSHDLLRTDKKTSSGRAAKMLGVYTNSHSLLMLRLFAWLSLCASV